MLEYGQLGCRDGFAEFGAALSKRGNGTASGSLYTSPKLQKGRYDLQLDPKNCNSYLAEQTESFETLNGGDER